LKNISILLTEGTNKKLQSYRVILA